MRPLLCWVILLGTSASVLGQDEATRRFGIKQYPQLYPQDTPQKALASALDAIDKERYDYLAAHLLDPVFIDDQLKSTYPHYFKIASDKAQKDGSLRPRPDIKRVRAQIADAANAANMNYLLQRLRTKIMDDPQSLVELRQMLSHGVVQENGDTATIRLKDLKDRTVYLKKVEGRWFLENRLNDEAAEK